MSRSRRLALAVGLLVFSAGLLGLAGVGATWHSAVCPGPPTSKCPHPDTLSSANATVIVVGAVLAATATSTGGLVLFITSYFPEPVEGYRAKFGYLPPVGQGGGSSEDAARASPGPPERPPRQG